MVFPWVCGERNTSSVWENARINAFVCAVAFLCVCVKRERKCYAVVFVVFSPVVCVCMRITSDKENRNEDDSNAQLFRFWLPHTE